nr:MAG TPA: hypothetical protein [Caudoviricetes sp.]
MKNRLMRRNWVCSVFLKMISRKKKRRSAYGRATGRRCSCLSRWRRNGGWACQAQQGLITVR